MTQITASHLQPHALRRPPRRPPAPAPVRADRRVRPFAWLLVLVSLLALGRGTSARAEVTGRTPFAVGSVTKLLTWTAVMQQVERGRLSLDDGVNRHLSFRIPEAFDAPVRVRDLTTHTAGFEDRPRAGLRRRDAVAVPELGAVLADRVPERIHAPGRYASGSNYGTALAGHLVERVAGRFRPRWPTSPPTDTGASATSFKT